MPDTQSPEGAVTIASQTVELLLTGKPDVPYKWGTGSIRPRMVVFVYRQDGIRAHLYGTSVNEDGELTDQPCDQGYGTWVNDTNWPDWLVELAADHDPRTMSAAAVRTGLREQIAKVLARTELKPPFPHCLAMADAVMPLLPASVDRATVLNEAATFYDRLLADMGSATKCDPRYWQAIQRVATELRGVAAEARTTEPHACTNCEGIDPDTCWMNPDRPPEQCPAAEFEDYGQQCTKPSGHNLHSFEEQQPDATPPAVGVQQPKETDGDRIVAYRSALPGALSVYCTNHTAELGDGVMPLTSEDLPDGGLCTQCGADVLIQQQPAGA